MIARQLALTGAAAFLATLTGCATEPISVLAATPVTPSNHLLYLPKEAATLEERWDGYEHVIVFTGQDTPDDTVPVTVVRDVGFVGSGCAARVLVNDQVAAYVREGEKVTLHIPPGEVILGADINTGGLCLGTGLAEIEANLALGKPRNYRIGIDASGSMRLHRTVDR